MLTEAQSVETEGRRSTTPRVRDTLKASIARELEAERLAAGADDAAAVRTLGFSDGFLAGPSRMLSSRGR